MDTRETAEKTAGAEPSADVSRAPRASRRNGRVVVGCVLFVAAMVGVTYASVPLYRAFCSMTGFGGATRTAEGAATKVLDRKITVRFDGNVAPGLPWDFRPEATSTEVKVGETSMAYYFAASRGRSETYANATYNVMPSTAGAYFVKLQCFCFNEQKLEAGEKVDMPVVFYIDPAIADDPEMDGLTTITLSYTFFPAAKPAAAQAAAPAPKQKVPM
ncbi:cytochrome c oxidase assembly protein [Azorhizobium caulinodans]|uniref:Cytochrome c oxidase assembly protein CtaG n=1 Tax=Azorhizobium caulinodans (strain ATCC 43989 / DSM 5975 / JCM 20966 / LMG 6465 / NBRC 14845 / NCIMB 13405 / ORS 571) TaxID=438753 RepID=A8IDK9_AZOC5|nr:cytochrome c oxidase assembly protein [Azorhizobium caulinodans]BAF88954.1 cytochrome C oxidase assembly protein [Azorhizobium caulinodans ORS 571]